MPLRALLLRLHRWTTLIFAVPLAVVIVTGAILSIEPILSANAPAGVPTLAAVEAALAKHDPENRARGLAIRAHAGTMTINRGQGGPVHLDLATGAEVASPGALAEVMTTARRMHETLLLDLGWLVTASTWAMLALIALGLAMGWPRFANSLSGWHKVVAWCALPVVILSPVTGLLLAYGISIGGGPPPRVAAPAPNLLEAVRTVAASHDLSRLVWIRTRGRDAFLARVWVGDELKVHAVGRDGLVASPRNWVRGLHEGNVAGVWSAGANVIASLAFVVLMATGLVLWARRKLKPRRRREPALAVPG